MKTLLFAGLAGAMALMPATASAAIESAPESNTALDISFTKPMALVAGAQNSKLANRTSRDGARVRLGRLGYGRGYRRPFRGFLLPRTFIQPRFYIANYSNYGLRRPAYGYGWSRYYDDAVLTDRRGIVYDSVHNLDWDRYNQGYNDGYRAGQATYDTSVLIGDDQVVATPSGAHGGSSIYQGDWDGAYQEDGSYQGDWQGTYRDAEGKIYEGQYSGTFIGNGDAAQVGGSHAEGPHWSSEGPVRAGTDYEPPRYDAKRNNRREEELAYLERCKKSSGIGGAVVGGAIGALAGNRIAGRGNRLGGSLIGAGVGALAGAAIDQGTDRCRKLLKKYGERPQYSRTPQYQPQHRYPSGWHGGYYYPAYYQPTVTTIVIQSAPVTTTTTYIDEEVVYTKAKPAKKRWKSAPKRVWKAKPKRSAPVKGCQQECCLYCD